MVGLEIARTLVGAVALAAGKVSPLDKKFKIARRLCGPFPEGPCLWMHGASLGECKMLLGLAERLRSDFPDLPRILITTQKAEVESFLKPLAARVRVSVSIAPLDTRRGMETFMETAKPQMLVLAENELWPGFLSSMGNRFDKPSVALLSGRFYRCLSTADFDSIGFVSMQTDADLGRLMAADDYLLSAKAIVGGDWKLLPWAASGGKISEGGEKSVDTAFLSFHREEAKALLEMLGQATRVGESAVLAPRFETDVPFFRRALAERNIPAVEWPAVKRGAVSLVTVYGKISEVLKAARSSVVGGPFARTLGVHDFWESLRMGVPTCIGPYCRGQREAIRRLKSERAIAQILKPSDYAGREFPPAENVERFLSREREKILASYRAFGRFVETVLKRNGNLDGSMQKGSRNLI